MLATRIPCVESAPAWHELGSPWEVSLRRSVVVLGALALLSVAGPASAEPPVEMTEQITDRVGALGSGAPAAEQAVADLAAEDDLALHAAFVSSFGSTPSGDWVEETAQLSELGGSAILLAVAVGADGTYQYSWWADETFPLAEEDVEAVMTREVEPRLEAGDRSGAVVALATQLRSLAEPGAAEDAAAQAAPWSATTIILIVGGVAVVLLAAHLLSRRKSSTNRRKASAPPS